MHALTFKITKKRADNSFVCNLKILHIYRQNTQDNRLSIELFLFMFKEKTK